ncbi:hypothetical protein [Bacillus sp. MUM 116]|nr:hypothetical protein [Bacillus sp. MUM 116]
MEGKRRKVVGKKGEPECKLPKAEGKEPKPVGEQNKDETGG